MTGIVADGERLARAQLTYLAEPGDELLRVLVRANGAVRAVEVIRSGCLTGAQWPLPQAVPAVMTALGRAMGRWHSQLGQAPAPAEITRTLGAGIRLICPGDHEWPGQLDDLGDATGYLARPASLSRERARPRPVTPDTRHRPRPPVIEPRHLDVRDSRVSRPPAQPRFPRGWPIRLRLAEP